MTHGLEGRCSVQLSYGRQGGATRAQLVDSPTQSRRKYRGARI